MAHASVFKAVYQVVGEGLPVAAAFFAEIEAVRKEQWKLVDEFGGAGMRPDRITGRIRSIYFKELPKHWRPIGKDGSLIEAVPHRGFKEGKELARKLEISFKCPDENHLARRFGWDRDYSVMSASGGKSLIHWASTTRLILPTERIFITLPRQIGDGFIVPDTLREVTEGEFMRAIAEHNDAVAARRKAA